jgi:ubiquinone/menaquinone biosynthesis C-methylase UbiE
MEGVDALDQGIGAVVVVHPDLNWARGEETLTIPNTCSIVKMVFGTISGVAVASSGDEELRSASVAPRQWLLASYENAYAPGFRNVRLRSLNSHRRTRRTSLRNTLAVRCLSWTARDSLSTVAEVTLRLRLDRWYLGLHGLALLRSYPYGDPAEAEERMNAMRSLLAGEGDPETFVAQEFDVLGLEEAYASWSETYDDPNPLIAAEERALLPILDRAARGVALDVASGTGRVGAHLRRRGHRVIACDRSEEMLRRARDRLEGTPMVRADILHLPVRDASVDLVTCALALTHVHQLPAAFASFARVVRSGGLAVISDIHPFAVATGAQAFFRRGDGSRAVARNEQHWMSEYVAAATGAAFVIDGCEEVFVDEALLREFAPDGYAESALLGLPFGLIWVLRRE